jgi:dienelactone hydrolase
MARSSRRTSVPNMLRTIFHAWERRLASATKNRVVRPFEWGLEWIPANGSAPDAAPQDVMRDWVAGVMANTSGFFTPPPTSDYTVTRAGDGDHLTFPSAFVTPHAENNTVHCRYFPARLKPRVPTAGEIEREAFAERPRAAVLVLPQWNADANGHVGLCRLLAKSGLSALRLSLPYHDRRMPPELQRADYIVSSNIARTVQVCRQAVLDARRAIHWLRAQGYARIGILGSSLGSCLALLTTAHEPVIHAQALNHISPYFADVVWRGLSTRHVRQGLDGHIDLDLLRTLWAPISPQLFLDRLQGRPTLLVYGKYDLTFPVDLSEDLVRAFREHEIPHEVAALRCGHYSIGKAPFKYVDGWILTRFLKRALTGT